MGIKHATIEQIDGCCEDLDSDTENEEYKSSLHYWKNGLLWGGYQTFMDDMAVEASDLDLNDIEIEKTKVSEAKKEALRLKNYMYFPPWDSNWNVIKLL